MRAVIALWIVAVFLSSELMGLTSFLSTAISAILGVFISSCQPLIVASQGEVIRCR